MALKIIGAGLGRTGTLSLKVALEQLGFAACYHMSEVIMNPRFARYWLEAADGRPDWERVFDGYQATVDFPGCRFWRELAAAYPEAKVILSVRDPEKWFESTQATIFSEQNRARVQFPEFGDFFERIVFAPFAEGIHDRAFMIDAFERHNSEVRRAIPPERLLVFEAKQGWAPLCEFLGVPVPDTPYPRTNSREEMAAMIETTKTARAAADQGQGLAQIGELVRARLESFKRPG